MGMSREYVHICAVYLDPSIGRHWRFSGLSLLYSYINVHLCFLDRLVGLTYWLPPSLFFVLQNVFRDCRSKVQHHQELYLGCFLPLSSPDSLVSLRRSKQPSFHVNLILYITQKPKKTQPQNDAIHQCQNGESNG